MSESTVMKGCEPGRSLVVEAVDPTPGYSSCMAVAVGYVYVRIPMPRVSDLVGVSTAREVL